MELKSKLLEILKKFNMKNDNYDEFSDILKLLYKLQVKTLLFTDNSFTSQDLKIYNAYSIYYFILNNYLNKLFYDVFILFNKFLQINKDKELKLSSELILSDDDGTNINILEDFKQISNNTESNISSNQITLNLIIFFAIYMKIHNHDIKLDYISAEQKNIKIQNASINVLLSNLFLSKENNQIYDSIYKFYSQHYSHIKFGFITSKIHQQPRVDVNIDDITSKIDHYTFVQSEYNKTSLQLYIILCKKATLIYEKIPGVTINSINIFDNIDKIKGITTPLIESIFNIQNSKTTEINILNIFNNNLDLNLNNIIPYIGFTDYQYDFNDTMMKHRLISDIYSYNIDEYVLSDTIYNKYYELFNIEHNKILLKKYILNNIDNGKGLFGIIFYIEIIGVDDFINDNLNNKNIFLKSLHNILFNDISELSLDTLEFINKLLYCHINDKKILVDNYNNNELTYDNITINIQLYDYSIYLINKLVNKLINKLTINETPFTDLDLKPFTEIYNKHLKNKVTTSTSYIDSSIIRKLTLSDIIVVNINYDTKTIIYNNVSYSLETIYDEITFNNFTFSKHPNKPYIFNKIKYSKTKQTDFQIVKDQYIYITNLQKHYHI
jgi:hypothetical protein